MRGRGGPVVSERGPRQTSEAEADWRAEVDDDEEAHRGCVWRKMLRDQQHGCSSARTVGMASRLGQVEQHCQRTPSSHNTASKKGGLGAEHRCCARSELQPPSSGTCSLACLRLLHPGLFCSLNTHIRPKQKRTRARASSAPNPTTKSHENKIFEKKKKTRRRAGIRGQGSWMRRLLCPLQPESVEGSVASLGHRLRPVRARVQKKSVEGGKNSSGENTIG